MNEDALPDLFRLAKNISKHSEYHIKMGAVLVRHGKPLSVGFNKIKSHTKWSVYPRQTIHAEVSALISSGVTDLRGCTMFIYRERNGNPAMARPCSNCMKVLKSFGIRRIYYTTNTYPYFEVEKVR